MIFYNMIWWIFILSLISWKDRITSLLTTESVLSQFFMKVIHGTFGIQKQSFAAIFQKGSRIPEIKNRVTDYNVIKPS